MSKINVDTMRLLDDRVLILPVETEDTYVNSVIIKLGRGELEGKRGFVYRKADKVTSVEEGHEVLFPKMAGFDVNINGVDYKMMRSTDLEAIVEK